MAWPGCFDKRTLNGVPWRIFSMHSCGDLFCGVDVTSDCVGDDNGDGVGFTFSIPSSFLDFVCKHCFFDVFCMVFAVNGLDGEHVFDVNASEKSLVAGELATTMDGDVCGGIASKSLPKPELKLLESWEL